MKTSVNITCALRHIISSKQVLQDKGKTLWKFQNIIFMIRASLVWTMLVMHTYMCPDYEDYNLWNVKRKKNKLAKV